MIFLHKKVLSNGLTIIYKHSENNLTSFSIAFEAGANVENENEIGLAHVVEHMLYKGTFKRNEYEINKLCDELFGFNNAMTNYPYVVYYATCLSEDFEIGFDLYADIILNPYFPKKGFKEEIDVICEELNEWRDDINQFCEDELFKNAFNKRRLKELIIGNEKNIKYIKLEHVIDFYNRYYTPDNCVISVVSSLNFEKVCDIIYKHFGNWNRKSNNIVETIYENNTPGVFWNKKDINGSKIQYCFPIHNLSTKEEKALMIFNAVFGTGTSSILYDEIRTKRGLAYDIASSIKFEKGIKVFKISMGTSKVNEMEAIELINSIIREIKNNSEYFNKYFNESSMSNIVKGIVLRNALSLEKSIVECVRLAVFEIMFRDRSEINSNFSNLVDIENYMSPLYERVNDLDKITYKDIILVMNKVLVKPTIQIISSND
ncbi:M16 family metallopeptidase [Clostridium tepidiprofundi]|uniref:M16 family metallopeptidase n=1 Tax=Clostridium tepidiprofundi TaxID=420412 RepID=UPI003BFA6B03